MFRFYLLENFENEFDKIKNYIKKPPNVKGCKMTIMREEQNTI